MNGGSSPSGSAPAGAGATVLPLRRVAPAVSAEGREGFLAQIDALLRGPGRGEALRTRAREDFAQLAFPTQKQEAWKYTSLQALTRESFTPAPELPLSPEQLRALGLDAAAHAGPRLVFVDGRLSPSLSRTEGLPAGVTVGSLAQAVAGKHPAAARLGTVAQSGTHPFTALNTALWSDGAFVHLAPGSQLGTLELVHVSVAPAAGAPATARYPRLLVVADRDSQGLLVERFEGVGGPGTTLSAAVAELWLGPNAQLSQLRVTAEPGLHLGVTQVHQSAHSRFRSAVFDLGGKLSRTELSVTLAEPGAETSLDGLYLADGAQHVDHQTWVDHAVPHCTSSELYKGVLGGKATAVFNGRVMVRKDAQKTQAGQTNKTLLLSAGAVVDAKPQMEIHADDVKAAHGAAVGQLDPTQLFYLRSRGLGLVEAKELLTHAFSREVVDRIEDEALRARIDARVGARLQELARGGGAA